MEIEGYDSSVGFTQWTNKPATKNADVRESLALNPHNLTRV